MKDLIKLASRPILSRLVRFKGAHKGESCYLFGDGNSIKYFDLNNFSDKISIPCGFLPFHNDFHVLNVPYALLIETYYFYPFARFNRVAVPPQKVCINHIQREYRKQIQKNSEIEFFISLTNYPVFFKSNITFVYRDIPDNSLEKDYISNKFNCYKGSLRAQIMLAIYMGFDHVYLVGHDYTHSPARSHHWYEKGYGVITPMDDFSKDFLEYAQKFINITTITTNSESVNLDYVKYNEFCGDKLKYKENTEILKEKYLNVLDTAAPYNIY
jgi:hypothetical protein